MLFKDMNVTHFELKNKVVFVQYDSDLLKIGEISVIRFRLVI